MALAQDESRDILTARADGPLVSVILPTHNRASLVGRAISSVLEQTYDNLELIVIDDSSTDHTTEVLATFQDARMHVLRLESNSGAAAARNIGIHRARGGLIAFNDDDDIWFAPKLERQVDALTQAPPGIGWCLCGFVRKTSERRYYIGGSWYYEQLDFDQGANRTLADGGRDWSLIATPGWLVKRVVLEQTGLFDERIRSWDDWELGLRLEKTCQRIFVDEPLFMQDVAVGGGLTRAERAQANDMRIILDEHGAMWRTRPRVMARHYFIIGRVENKYEGSAAGREYLLRSLRLWPFSLRTWGALVLSLAGPRGGRTLMRFVHRVRSTVRRVPTGSRRRGHTRREPPLV